MATATVMMSRRCFNSLSAGVVYTVIVPWDGPSVVNQSPYLSSILRTNGSNGNFSSTGGLDVAN